MPDNEITLLLNEMAQGDNRAEGKLLAAIYQELHELAAGYMKRERPGHTLQATLLVNEAYMRLVGERQIPWQSRSHFFVTAARTMRRILIDHARRHAAGRRGAGEAALRLEDVQVGTATDPDVMLSIDRALEELAALDARQAQIVELRFFGGFSVE
jgi:RNA polymerase sigma-70 factor, ECF subfamily